MRPMTRFASGTGTAMHPPSDIQAAVNSWWSLCGARGYQVMPGCQGVPHADDTGTYWYVEYHVDMRGRRRVVGNA